MTETTYLERTGCYPLTKLPVTENLVIDLTHKELSCPFCGETGKNVCTWGSYKTEMGEIRRYQCYPCKKTFNPAKIPYIYERMSKVVYSLSKMIIKNGVSINKLAQELEIPKSTLQKVIQEIEAQLAFNFEYLKSLDLVLKDQLQPKKRSLRVIFYDEGFHRLLGGLYYLVFAVNSFGEVIQADLTSKRDGETVLECLEQAITKMGGVDVIVSDGASAVLNSCKNLRKSIILIQQIHSHTGKRARIIKLDPVLGTKRLRQLTLELHTESLKYSKESIARVNVKEVYPKKRQKSLAHQNDPKIKKNETRDPSREVRHLHSTGSSSKKEKEKKNPYEDVNWIWTPDTNF